MSRRKAKPEHLKLIQGKKQETKTGLLGLNKKPAFFIIFFLALFLLAQIIIGWAWGTVYQNTVATVMASEGNIPVTLSTAGLISFDEEVVLAPQPGFVYYKVRGGERVPVGKELVRIRELPLEEKIAEEKETSNFFQNFAQWFFHGERDNNDNYAPVFSLNNNAESVVVAPRAGVVSLSLDGFEKYGPASFFPYFTEEEFQEQANGEQLTQSGEKAYRFMPLLKIINNYYWYYSIVLPAEEGKLVAEQPRLEFIFSFSPHNPVWGEKVEVRKRGDGTELEITWCMDCFRENLFSQRWCSAAIVYHSLQGMLVPKSALLEVEGKKGVYIIENGEVIFWDVVVLAEKEDYFLVENLHLDHRVVINPEGVREGQHFYW